MKNKIKKFIRDLFILILFSSIAGYGWYLAVYQASFLPNGYEIISQEKDHLIIKSFTIFGMEDETKTLTFSERNEWLMDSLNYEVERQQGFFWLLFFGVSVSTFILIYRVRQGAALWKMLLSGFVGSIPLPLTIIIFSIKHTQQLINLTSY